MRYRGLDHFLSEGSKVLAKGPVALIFVEDLIEVESTIRHHKQIGFAQVLVFAPVELRLEPALEDQIHRIDYAPMQENAVETAVNAVSARAPGTWFYYGYNAEYLYYPFSETRKVGEMTTFTAEERRDSILTYVIDLYAGDLTGAPLGVNLEDAWLDKSGYFALARPDPLEPTRTLERQLDFYGGLRWRFEEHVPPERRRMDRIALFRAKPGLKLLENHQFSEPEYNTISCPWHNNITAAVASFRTAKALRSNAASRYDVRNFKWHNSVKFTWGSRQLLDLGMIEPGQWY